MNVGMIKTNVLKGLITITYGLLLFLPVLASADQILTDSISDQTSISDSQSRLQAYINQMLPNHLSNSNVSTTYDRSTKNNKNASSISPSTQTNSIISAIRNSFEPPVNNKSQVALRIRLDKKGDVLSASASGPNEQLNQAAIRAAWAASPSPLPIDLENPDKYSYIIVNFQTR